MPRSSLEPSDGVATLGPAERFLLWTMRAWVQGCKAKALPAVAVEDAFAAIGLREAAAALDAALRGVAQTTTRRLLVNCPHCPDLSEDERLLLDAASSAQNGQFDRAYDLLSEIVPPGSADFIVGPLSGLGRMLALAGIDLPCAEEACLAGRRAFGLDQASPTTLH